MNETLLFWLVLFGFLIFDNFIVIKQGKDAISISKSGRLFYKNRTRTGFLGKEVVVLNPFNLLDRVVGAQALTLTEHKQDYKQQLKTFRQYVKSLKIFVVIGWTYLLCLVVGCYFSFAVNFNFVVVPMLVCHFIAWTSSSVAIVLWNKNKTITKIAATTQIIENLLVPAYIVNLNKKLISHTSLELSSMRFYMRNLKRTKEDELDKVKYEILNLVNSELDSEVDAEKIQILEDYKKCLTT